VGFRLRRYFFWQEAVALRATVHTDFGDLNTDYTDFSLKLATHLSFRKQRAAHD